MHIHILGICGTFMGGIAAIARAAGHEVTGSDRAVYPPMSDQLRNLGIELMDGFGLEQLELKPDLVVVGNVMSRGMPIIEELLNRGMAYTSGPAWLAEHVLQDQWVIAVSGTHGKTTTASMTAWLLEAAGLEPGFLIGGVPANFATTARLGGGKFFVIEADEYDTAFFDKRAKFMHYGPRTLIINNLEFDHADIYADMDAILWQFHQMLRILPGNGQLIVNANEPEIERLIEMGCWTPIERYSSVANTSADVVLSGINGVLEIVRDGQKMRSGELALPGRHNLENATAAVLAAHHVGVDIEQSVQALQEFRGVKRRLEHLGTFAGVRVYDDFAHHPTAIRRTVDALRETTSGRVLVVLEPRSNSMKLGVHRAGLMESLADADKVWAYQPADLPWRLEDVLAALPGASVYSDISVIVSELEQEVRAGDDVVIMSNGGFGGIQQLVCDSLNQR
ncbi:MAG: UDP-N-acetylmuramate:L-alanyl-gamma-D-glutamyl-meso-diaminopimelate ligase [Gammaproteobacteria bacterium]|nr:MAG: UDP-N-acetylmuramate:L-alanyl-gamma-D-glutamyl-meso-diaminopimelate ligase [Gammaproteobacteria bacterium]